MDVQHETLLPAKPLARLCDDYGVGVIHLAWDRHSDDNARTLLFAFVELLPREVPPPQDDYDPKSSRYSCRLGSNSNHYVYVRHAVWPAQDALQWYSNCRQGIGRLPEDGGTSEKELKLEELLEDPTWPALITNGDEDEFGLLAFCPEWIKSPRTHHLLPRDELDLDSLWSDAEAQRAMDWLRDQLHFDFGAYPEYWGSVHLVAPNPVYRALDMRLLQSGPSSESVFLRFQPRAQRSVAGLDLVLHEKVPWGVTAGQRCVVDAPCVSVDFGREVGGITVDVLDPGRGYLDVSTRETAFIRSITFSLSHTTRTVIDAGDEIYEVGKSGEPEAVTVGQEPSTPSKASRLFTTYRTRQTRLRGAELGQQWYRGQKDEGRDALRGIIHTASSAVMVIDPYLGATELGNFALATSRYDIPIQILTSAKHLKERFEPADPRKYGEMLLDALDQLTEQQHVNPIEVRVMTGARPDIHDRFLLIDRQIWLLGNSLNKFGSRGTMMVALPDPDDVRIHLVEAWGEAMDLRTWVDRHRLESAGAAS